MSAIPKGFERVRCKCPPYAGSDFWNDPHRWCGVDAPTARVWAKDGPADCERTVRPVPKEPDPPDPYADYYRHLSLAAYQQSHLGSLQNSYLGGMGGGMFGGLFGFR